MDSYNFHFERMSNLDLHPLSRLSPAKSTSSIDQFSHHHGKGDSAYSSFSGGSNAPDYSSPFLPDEINPHSLHYADLKYVKAVYHPSVLSPSPRSMDQLYRSMEVISQQYHPHDSCLIGQYCNREPPQPPPPPARLDSFIMIRNLENSRACQSPEGQMAVTSHNLPQTVNPEAAYPRPDPGYSCGASQCNLRDLMGADGAAQLPEPQKLTSTVSRSPPAYFLQEGLKQQPTGSGGQVETQRHRSSISSQGSNCAELLPQSSPQHVTQAVTNGNIQHKGQFYFVTGMCKPSEPAFKEALSGVVEGEEEQYSAEGLRRLLEKKERPHVAVDDLHRNARHRRQSSQESQSDREAFHQSYDLKARAQYKERHSTSPGCSSPISEQACHGFEHFEQGQGREIGPGSRRHHSSSHHIFYCGPEDCVPPPNKDAAASLQNADQTSNAKADHLKRAQRPPLADVASEKISKETTPLLYHLTGESRAVLAQRSRSESDAKANWKELRRHSEALRRPHKEGPAHKEERSPVGEAPAEEQREQGESLADSCNTLDDSFKKYYKEKLKDAQCKVLRETSFKRKDLQLSWPHRVRPRPEQRPSVLGSVSSSQCSSLTSGSPVPSEPEAQEKDSGKESGKDSEKENGRPLNHAQPQVARIGGRKRLSPEQKKLCYSEPEKLHQLGDGPIHAAHSSLGNEKEALLSREDLTEQGLVASRRKMFETRGRALSASSLTKATLKEIQHKALVAYMERKTGHKTAEPQQPAPLTPGQRHSTAGKPSDWGPRPLSANAVPRKKLLRPLSAGRILDSSSSSIRYAQFTPAHPSAHARQSSWKETTTPAASKSASAESLLDQPEPPEFFRARSTSTPHAFQTASSTKEPSPEASAQSSSSAKKAEGEVPVMKTRAASVPEDRRVRVVAPRGKSMEELGSTRVSGTPVLSKSSDQLDQLHGRQAKPVREKRGVSFLSSEDEKPQGRSQMNPLVKQGSDPQLCSGEDSRAPKPGVSPVSTPSPQGRSHSSSPTSSGSSPIFTDAVANIMLHAKDLQVLPPPKRRSPEREPTSPPCPPKCQRESRTSSRIKTAPPVHSLLSELSAEDRDEVTKPGSPQEVSLSRGVTTDPSLWLITQEMPVPAPQPSVSPGDVASTKEDPNPLPTTPKTAEPQVATPTRVQDMESSQSSDGGPPGTPPEEAGIPSRDAEPPVSNVAAKTEPQWEDLVEEVVADDHSLARVLFPVTNRKTAMMLMEQLLSEDTLLMEEHYRKKQSQKTSNAQQAEDRPEMVEAKKTTPSSCENLDSDDQTQETKQPQDRTGSDVTEKKRLLVACIEGRLQALEQQRASLKEEVRVNGLRGGEVDALVQEACLPAEYERYALFIGDLERVVSLLLCLSARLARVQNALSTVDQNTDAEEKQSLDNRHRLLCKQREDAKDLKDNLDRRERVVSAILARHLTSEQLQDYRRFVQTKASLLILQKDLDERQRLGEEQLESLLNSIPP
ncbi:protein Shroom3 [Megalops cyprinoides]|uniref:protein Shroom3 n=1 Tax=Megalops cyprinoides TaxID=118141 RepID=UPI001863DD35|nr:protein Shroom3 [Megalops cyprinoides]XP_036381069.1 protein Shroom3 [Megalops cyprinoides]